MLQNEMARMILTASAPIKTALITGGSSGIGKATGDTLARHCWNVFCPSRRQLNLYDIESVRDYAAAFKEDHSSLDALILSAGEWHSEDWKTVSTERLFDQYMLNVVTNFELIRLLMPLLECARGVVVAVSSTRGFIGGLNTMAYSCAKAAEIAMIQGFVRESESGVEFYCVCPGLTDTPLGANVIKTGGAAPTAVPQPVSAVSDYIVECVENGSNFPIARIVDSKMTKAEWRW